LKPNREKSLDNTPFIYSKTFQLEGSFLENIKKKPPVTHPMN
jgi:hypothetical protein